MKPKLHFYNPGHETAILRKGNYTPPRNVQKMITELAFLPIWYADKGDYVFIENKRRLPYWSELPEEIRPDVNVFSKGAFRLRAASFPEMVAAPWGLSLLSIEFYKDLMTRYKIKIDLPVWKDDYERLTGRQTGAACFQRIRELLPDLSLPSVPVFFSKTSDIEDWLHEQQGGTSVIKTPFSSSGRGLLWLDENILTEEDKHWLKGALKKQGSISIEPALNKMQDFALEFFIDEQGDVRYEGLSAFETSLRGAYRGNIMMPQERLEDVIFHPFGKELLERIKEVAKQAIRETYAGYSGYIGIDMFTYKTAEGQIAIHPCVEVNMRYTIGMIAIRLFEQYIHPEAKGVFKIFYNKSPKASKMTHIINKREHPLEFKDGKLRAGYLPLCPVVKTTYYTACIIMQ